MDHMSLNDQASLDTRYKTPNGGSSAYFRQIETSKTQGRRHDLDQKHVPRSGRLSRTENLNESPETGISPCCNTVVQERYHRRPALKVQAIKFPLEQDDLEETILQLRLFKSIGYSDFEIAFGYCNQSPKLTNMFCNLQSNQKADLEEFFNALRSRRPVDIGKAIRDFFNKRQGRNEDEDDVMFFLKSRYNLMHGRPPGELNRSALTEGEKFLLRYQFSLNTLENPALPTVCAFVH